MEYNILGFGRDPERRWCHKVARASVNRIAAAVADVASELAVSGTIAFDPGSRSNVKAVVASTQRVASELEVGFWLPTADWSSVEQATPRATAALGSALLGLAESLGADAMELEAALQGLEVSEAPAVVELADPSPEDQLPDLHDWLESFSSIPADLRSLTSDDSPIGSDTGSDLLHAYRIWRAERQPISEFLPALLKRWEVPERQWNLTDPVVLKEQLPRSHYEILTRDDAIIALAFSQYLVDSSIQASVGEKALLAIDRQSLDVVLDFRGWTDRDRRRELLGRMKSFLESHRERPS